jgi:hypothetical protein
VALGDHFRREFAAGVDELWVALVRALPVVTTHAAFYYHDRRVEWTIDTTGFMWRQSMTAAVEPDEKGSALVVTGQTEVRASLLAPHARAHAFHTLADAVAHHLAEPPPEGEVDTDGRDEYRWWNGLRWTYDPPLSPPEWRPDPAQQHELRYWDGRDWTPHVADQGVVGFDPVP